MFVGYSLHHSCVTYGMLLFFQELDFTVVATILKLVCQSQECPKLLICDTNVCDDAYVAYSSCFSCTMSSLVVFQVRYYQVCFGGNIMDIGMNIPKELCVMLKLFLLKLFSSCYRTVVSVFFSTGAYKLWHLGLI